MPTDAQETQRRGRLSAFVRDDFVSGVYEVVDVVDWLGGPRRHRAQRRSVEHAEAGEKGTWAVPPRVTARTRRPRDASSRTSAEPVPPAAPSTTRRSEPATLAHPHRLRGR